MIKILIVDDHDIIREGIKSLLASFAEFFVCGEANSAQEALEKIEQLKPDIVLLDVSLGSLSGLDIVTRIKKVSAQTKIIMITVHKMGAYVIKAVRLGVEGYINKENVVDELVPAINRVMDNKTYLGASVVDYVTEVISENSDKVSYSKFFSDRELDIIRLCAEGKTSKEIAEILFLSRRTVENHKNIVLKKLNLHKTSDLIKYAIENKIIDSRQG